MRTITHGDLVNRAKLHIHVYKSCRVSRLSSGKKRMKIKPHANSWLAVTKVAFQPAAAVRTASSRSRCRLLSRLHVPQPPTSHIRPGGPVVEWRAMREFVVPQGRKFARREVRVPTPFCFVSSVVSLSFVQH
jgi:hypothetical protein